MWKWWTKRGKEEIKKVNESSNYMQLRKLRRWSLCFWKLDMEMRFYNLCTVMLNKEIDKSSKGHQILFQFKFYLLQFPKNRSKCTTDFFYEVTTDFKPTIVPEKMRTQSTVSLKTVVFSRFTTVFDVNHSLNRYIFTIASIFYVNAE